MKKDLKLLPFDKSKKIKVHARFSTGHGLLKCHFKFSDPSNEITYYDFPQNQRLDHLWQETCLEAFIYQPSTKQYLEFNLSPKNGAWNVYHFQSYRQLSEKQPDWKNLQMLKSGMGFIIELIQVEKWLGPPPYQLALTCVAKCRKETLYFALAHLDHTPNFHYSPSYLEPLKY